MDGDRLAELPHHVAQMAVQFPSEQGGYERRIRLASEVATWGIAAILVASAALPTTDTAARVGLLFSATLLVIFALIWFHLLPESVFGRLRFTIGACITQVMGGILLVLTGGGDSRYFVFFLFPTLATTFAMRVSSTLVTGAIAIVVYLTLLLGDGILAERSTSVLDIGAIHLAALIAIIAMTALISRTMQETRATLRQRTIELADHNRELEIARSTALQLARARELPEIVRAVYDAARSTLRIERVFFFSGSEDMESGYTVGLDGRPVRFQADRRLRDSPRQRAVRTRHTVVMNDASLESGVSERVRSEFQTASGLFVPLLHRGEMVALIVLGDSIPRDWSPGEVRLGEVIAESAAPGVASMLALEKVREQSDRLAERTNVLEGMNQLVENLSLATDEASTAEVGARSVAGAFRLDAATTLVVDPSLALLETGGIAGAASQHPVVNGPTNCPAIRSGRTFRVASGDAPMICPYMPFKDGSHGYECVPLFAGAEPVGALFMEPGADSILEETFTRNAADRIALSIANRRVLETAQRQATTDGLTGLHNRHFLQEQLRILQSLATRHGQPYSVIAIDVDGLKQVNDTFGHEMGDLALRGFANTVRKTIRGSDIGVRTGGDEFLVLIPKGGLSEAGVLAERLRDAVEQQGRAEPHTAISVSVGVAAWRSERTAEQVLEAADAMLYAAKRAGKDRVMVEAPAAAGSEA